MNVLSKECCARIKENMKELKITHESLAVTLNLSTSAISNYVNGLRMPNADVFYGICHTLGITVEWALTGQGEKRAGKSPRLSNEEAEFLAAFRKLSYEQRTIIQGKIYELLLNVQTGQNIELFQPTKGNEKVVI